jgi:DNA-binding response OmpR family regulator
MARRKNESGGDGQSGTARALGATGTTSGNAAAAASTGATTTRRVLVAAGDIAENSALTELIAGLAAREIATVQVSNAKTLRDHSKKSVCGVALVMCDLIDMRTTDACKELSAGGLHVILSVRGSALTAATDALRAGASDVVPADAPVHELIARVMAGIERRTCIDAERDAARRADAAKIERLRTLCKKLNDARSDLTRQVGSLCNDLASAYQELSDQLVRVTMASEFSGVIRQELDLESLLRTVLEFVLAKIGPTNAAVFLPASSGDFTLGAYVNYDCPKDTAEMMLDHLSASLAPKFEHSKGVHVFANGESLETLLGDESDWIGESGLLVVPCRAADPTSKSDQDECLAVIALFRDRRTGFGEDAVTRMQIIADLFGAQLGRVIKVHHRHLPKHKWGAPGASTFDDPADDAGDIDLAA